MGREWQEAGIYKAGGLAIKEHVPDFNEVAVAKSVAERNEDDEIKKRWKEQKTKQPIYGEKPKKKPKIPEAKDRPAYVVLPKAPAKKK